MDLLVKGDSPIDGHNLTYLSQNVMVCSHESWWGDNNCFSLLIFCIVEKVQMKMKSLVILWSILIKSFEITTFYVLYSNVCAHVKCVDFDACIRWSILYAQFLYFVVNSKIDLHLFVCLCFASWILYLVYQQMQHAWENCYRWNEHFIDFRKVTSIIIEGKKV
jgi:hypothetical protein